MTGSGTLSKPARPISRPRVLRVATDLSVEGPGRQTISLNRELKSRGFDCRLAWGAASGESFEPPPSVPASYIPYLQSRVDLVADVRAFLTIDGMIRRWRPQIVHTHADKAGVLGRLAAQRQHVPITLHSFPSAVLREIVGESRAVIARERALARRMDALLVDAPEARDRMLHLGIGSRDQWHVVPMGLDLEPLIKERLDRREARAQLGLPSEGAIVGWVAGSGDEEDDGTFLTAAARLINERPETTVVFAGENSMSAGLRSRARDLLVDRGVFLRPGRRLPTLYAALDVVVRTSLRGTPTSLVEAAAAGKPVVATRAGGIREVVREGETGLLVSPRDPSALAASLLMLLEDPEGARRMGEEGTAWVRDRFSAHRLAEDMSSIYLELLDRRAFTFGRFGPQRVLPPVHPRFSGSASAIR